MYPPQFDYYRAASLEEALETLAAHGGDARPLAGGQSLLTELKNGRSSPGTLVDVGGIDALEGIDVEDERTTVGATTTYAAVLESDAVWERAPALAEATANVGDRQIRNRGTVGGNLAQADPDGDLPAAALASDATIAVRGRDGERTVDAADFFRGPNRTALEAGELVTELRVPHAGRERGASGGAYVKKTHPASGYAMVGVAAVVDVDADGTIGDARLAANGVADRARRLSALETALVGESATDPDALEAAAERAGDGIDSSALRSDHHASGEFRRSLLPTYAERALSTALDRAVGAGVDGGNPTAADGGDER